MKTICGEPVGGVWPPRRERSLYRPAHHLLGAAA
jgi:hypothetical protein